MDGESKQIIASFQGCVSILSEGKNDGWMESRPTRILVTQYLRMDGDHGPS